MNYLLRLAAIPLAALCISMNAQDTKGTSLNVSLSTRADYIIEHPNDDSGDLSGFHGRYLNMKIDGSIGDKFSYSWRQRINKSVDASSDVFAATDWIYLTYRPDQHWSFAGGKQVVLIGGYEYDAAPIDVFFASIFWNNVGCFQFGASASYTLDDGNNTLSFQVSNSPFTGTSGKGYAYNLYWAGNLGSLSTLWSANMIEYRQGHFVNYISLGNKVNFGNFDMTLDLMNRTVSANHFFNHDFTIVSKAKYRIAPAVTVFVKGGYEEYKLIPDQEHHVDSPLYGGGFEFYPLKGSRDVRIHAFCDRVCNVEGVKTTEVNLGISWWVDLYKRGSK